MTAKNSVTGDTIATRPSTDEYRENYDRIWGKKEQQKMDNRKAFVDGAKWWQAQKNGATAFASEVDQMEREANTRYSLPSDFINVVQIARELKIGYDKYADCWTVLTEGLERFASMVANIERTRCAAALESMYKHDREESGYDEGWNDALDLAEQAILSVTKQAAHNQLIDRNAG